MNVIVILLMLKFDVEVLLEFKLLIVIVYIDNLEVILIYFSFVFYSWF